MKYHDLLTVGSSKVKNKSLASLSPEGIIKAQSQSNRCKTKDQSCKSAWCSLSQRHSPSSGLQRALVVAFLWLFHLKHTQLIQGSGQILSTPVTVLGGLPWYRHLQNAPFLTGETSQSLFGDSNPIPWCLHWLLSMTSSIQTTQLQHMSTVSRSVPCRLTGYCFRLCESPVNPG